jgi:Domain of unknown function (DUF4270)
LGQDLLNKFKNDADEIKTQNDFVNYFKGIYIGTDTTRSKSLYYFTGHFSNALIRLHYRLNSITAVEKHIDFSVNSRQHTNYVNSRFTGTALAPFTPFKKQLRGSNLTANRVYVHSSAGLFAKISFPDLLRLKELYPYIRVIKAVLEIKPAPGTYNYPYTLPDVLNLYGTDDENGFNFTLRTPDGSRELTGDLLRDNLYGEQTMYSYDITAFITNQINEGAFSKAALLLSPAGSTGDNTLQRLVINDQSVAKSVQLKLYVLGL